MPRSPLPPAAPPPEAAAPADPDVPPLSPALIALLAARLDGPPEATHTFVVAHLPALLAPLPATTRHVLAHYDGRWRGPGTFAALGRALGRTQTGARQCWARGVGYLACALQDAWARERRGDDASLLPALRAACAAGRLPRRTLGLVERRLLRRGAPDDHALAWGVAELRRPGGGAIGCIRGVGPRQVAELRAALGITPVHDG